MRKTNKCHAHNVRDQFVYGLLHTIKALSLYTHEHYTFCGLIEKLWFDCKPNQRGESPVWMKPWKRLKEKRCSLHRGSEGESERERYAINDSELFAFISVHYTETSDGFWLQKHTANMYPSYNERFFCHTRRLMLFFCSLLWLILLIHIYTQCYIECTSITTT